MSDNQKTEVSLRPWAEGDLLLLQRLMGDPTMMEQLGGPESPEKILSRHARYYLISEMNNDRMFAILAGTRKIAVGSIGFWEKEWHGQQIWETGWSVIPEFQGLGIATQAAFLIVQMTRESGIHYIMHAFPAVINAPSNAICDKAGFKLLGEVEFEYPPGNLMRCNDWMIDLFA